MTCDETQDGSCIACIHQTLAVLVIFDHPKAQLNTRRHLRPKFKPEQPIPTLTFAQDSCLIPPSTTIKPLTMAGIALSETNELLEQILLHLPMKEIILARAVSRQWKALIQTSLPLKRATWRGTAAEDHLTIDRFYNPQHYRNGGGCTPPLLIAESGFIINPMFPCTDAEVPQTRPSTLR